MFKKTFMSWPLQPSHHPSLYPLFSDFPHYVPNLEFPTHPKVGHSSPSSHEVYFPWGLRTMLSLPVVPSFLPNFSVKTIWERAYTPCSIPDYGFGPFGPLGEYVMFICQFQSEVDTFLKFVPLLKLNVKFNTIVTLPLKRHGFCFVLSNFPTTVLGLLRTFRGPFLPLDPNFRLVVHTVPHLRVPLLLLPYVQGWNR